MKILSLLPPEEIMVPGGKISPVAICGHFEGETADPDTFMINPVFLDFLHETIRTKGPALHSLIQAAGRQHTGYLYIIDFRTPEGIMGNVPAEDIIGSFKVADGKLVADGYAANPSYKVFTKNGVTRLPPGLDKVFLDELRKRNITG